MKFDVKILIKDQRSVQRFINLILNDWYGDVDYQLVIRQHH